MKSISPDELSAIFDTANAKVADVRETTNGPALLGNQIGILRLYHKWLEQEL